MINFFVLSVNQLTIAKMDNISILQIIERIPELTLKYIGSCPGDKNPQLSKFELTLKYIGSYPADETSTTEIVFAKLNSAPSNDKGEHWTKFTTLVICWVEKHQNINLILYNKKVSANKSANITKNR